MPDQFGEKSQEPTPHRRQKAREEGHVPQSQDLTSAVLLLVALVALWTLGQELIDFLAEYLGGQLGQPPPPAADAQWAASQWYTLAQGLADRALPLLLVILVAAVAINVLQMGFLLLPQRVQPDPSRINPLKGFARLFSVANVARLVFGIFKVALVGAVAFWAVWAERETILGLAALTVPEIAVYLIEVLFWTTAKVAAALLILAILDYGFQWWKNERDLRMTPQEVREELKHLEGDPQVIARRRAVQRQLVLNRLSTAVPKADVVITNPTELAVAIQYDPETMAAPIVVAKGAGLLARRIRQIALENGIPILERKPLAQALYREVDINHPIPRDKYAAVAEVLAYVYQLKGKGVATMRSVAA